MKIVNQTNKLQEISVLRAFSIVCVVFFHTYGMMYADHFPSLKKMYSSLYYTTNQCILINIAMPMFVVVSGYLFSHLIKRDKYSTFKDLVLNKCKRILLPYFMFGIILMAATNNFHPLELLRGNYWHLWFLPMLFWCFIITWLINKLPFSSILSWNILMLISSFLLALLPSFAPQIFGLQGLSFWFCWFYLGWFLDLYSNRITQAMSQFSLVWIFIFVYLAITIVAPTSYGDNHWYSQLSQICIIVSLWYIVRNINWSKYKISNHIILFSNCSFGIYIVHYLVASYLISQTAQRLLPLEKWGEQHVIIFPLAFSLGTLIISYIFTKLMISTKIGRSLVG